MKNVFRAALLMALIAIPLVKATASELVLQLDFNARYEIRVNGFVYQVNDHHFILNGLEPGNHHIEVLEKRINRRGYVRYNTVYAGYIHVPQFSKVIARLHDYNCLDIIRVVRYRNYNRGCDTPRYGRATAYHHNRGRGYYRGKRGPYRR